MKSVSWRGRKLTRKQWSEAGFRRNPITAPARATASLSGLLTLGVIALAGLWGLDWLRKRGTALLATAREGLVETASTVLPSRAEQQVNVMLATPAGSITRPVLRMGPTRPETLSYVIEAQNRLGIPTTGLFDAAMRDRVIAFQAARGLAPDGVIGPATWAALLGR
jgi:peptidoglycan hydrolase-like protein with peptidoglycan-binding domain